MTVTTQQRQRIRHLARSCCEYCRIIEGDRLVKFQIDHIIPIKHGGKDIDSNLCLACVECNSYKGPNVAAIDPTTQDATKLYHPREQNWDEHFSINKDASLIGLTPEGRATVFVLRMNDEKRISQRFGERLLGKYPCKQ